MVPTTGPPMATTASCWALRNGALVVTSAPNGPRKIGAETLSPSARAKIM